MSYKKAWTLIDSANKSAKQPITISNTGGKGGGGVTLTPYGIKMLEAFESLNKRCWSFLDAELSKMDL
jgi:molybdate transport system regulatory protein